MRRREPVVRREYRPSPEACECALKLLLERSVEKAAGSDGGRDEGKDFHMKGDSDHDLNEGTIRGAEGARHGQML